MTITADDVTKPSTGYSRYTKSFVPPLTKKSKLSAHRRPFMQVQNIVVTSVSEEYETVIAQPLASVLFLLIMSQPDDLFLTIFLTPCVCVCTQTVFC